MSKKVTNKTRGGDQSLEIYSRQLTGSRCVDYDHDGEEITIPVVGNRSLKSLVDPSNLPSYTTYDYNPKKGSYRERQVREDADEAIIGSAQRAQMRGEAFIRTGRPQQSRTPKMAGQLGMCAPMPSMPSMSRRKRG